MTLGLLRSGYTPLRRDTARIASTSDIQPRGRYPEYSTLPDRTNASSHAHPCELDRLIWNPFNAAATYRKQVWWVSYGAALASFWKQTPPSLLLCSPQEESVAAGRSPLSNSIESFCHRAGTIAEKERKPSMLRKMAAGGTACNAGCMPHARPQRRPDIQHPGPPAAASAALPSARHTCQVESVIHRSRPPVTFDFAQQQQQ